MSKWWTLGRSTAVGIVAGFAALLLWPAYAIAQEPLLIPFLAALAIAAFCGLSMLWITAADLLFHRRRGERLIPMRVFDVVVAFLLVIPSLTMLRALLA